jgi:hypothetical protein
MQGIANRVIRLHEYYVNDIYKMDERLLTVYKKMIILNEMILFLENANVINEKETGCGSTSVVTVKTYDRSTINVKGINFIALLHETIRALLDLISFNALPSDKKKAKYVLKKSDFRLAEKWDMCLGIPLWFNIEKQLPLNFEKYFYTIPYLFYEIITQPVNDFNNLLINVFAGTRNGKEELEKLYSDIQHNMEKESFEVELETKRNKIKNENNFFDINEL